MINKSLPSKEIDVVLVLVQPVLVEFGDNSSNVQKVSIVKVMVVIVAIAKINISVVCTSLIDDAPPASLVGRQSLGRRLKPVIKCSLEVIDDGLNEVVAANILAIPN